MSVSTGAGCAWTATSNANWLTITGGGAGNGPGEVIYQAAAGPGARSGTLTIAGRSFTVNQAAAACSFSIAPEAHNVDAGERNFNVDVNTTPGCAWAAASNAPWITLREPGGTGSRDVRVTVAANTGPARSGTATIAGRTLTITQAGVAACEYRVSPRDLKVDDRERRFVRIEVDTSNACSWTAVSNVEWITVVANSSGTGNGDVWLSVRENDGRQRIGTVTVAGQTVTVTQKKD